jgi:hypothetical protein
MTKKIYILFFVINTFSIYSQNTTIKSPSSFFPANKAQVLVVGTFHFEYPNIDYHKINDSNRVDVLNDPKKSEITELVEYIKKFKPNKIAIEAYPNWNATERLREYKLGKLRNERDEIVQLGMRIANDLKIDTLYSIDSESFSEDLKLYIDSNFLIELFKDFDFESDDKFDDMYSNLYEYNDKLATQLNLLEYFKYMNSEENHKLIYGQYLTGDFKLSNSRGADILSIWWYNRNLRIFRKLQEMTTNENDRILVIFGNGHASILRQLIESSPEYEFVEFDSLK